MKKKPLLILAGTVALVVIAYLGFDLLKGVVSPCESLFEQTSVQFGTKLKLVETEGELLIGRQKIQDLTEASQITALNLKACCVVLSAGNLDSKEFLACKSDAQKYEDQIDALVVQLDAAKAAKEKGNQALLEQRLSQIEQTVAAAKSASEELRNRVERPNAQSKAATAPKPQETVEAEETGHPPPKSRRSDKPGLKLTAIAARDSAPIDHDLYYWIYDARQDLEGKRREVARDGDVAPLIELPPGRYYVVVRHGNAYANVEVEVTAGRLTEQTINLNAGYLRVSAVAAEGAKAIDRDLYYWVYEAKKDLEGKRKEVASAGDAKPLFKLPAARYYVVVRHGDAYANAELDVSAGQLTEKTINLNAGYLRVSAVAAEGAKAIDRDLYYWVYEAKKDLEGRRREVASNGDVKPLFKLPAARYYVVVRHGDAYANAELDVSAGQLTEKIINLNAGYLRVSAVAAEGAKAIDRDLYYSVYEAKKDLEGRRREVASNGDAKPLFKLPAARYYVVVRHGDVRANVEVEIRAGQIAEQTIQLP